MKRILVVSLVVLAGLLLSPQPEAFLPGPGYLGFHEPTKIASSGGPASGSGLQLENSDFVLLENGDFTLLE